MRGSLPQTRTSQRWPQSETTEPSTVTVLNLNGAIEVEEKKVIIITIPIIKIPMFDLLRMFYLETCSIGFKNFKIF